MHETAPIHILTNRGKVHACSFSSCFGRAILLGRETNPADLCFGCCATRVLVAYYRTTALRVYFLQVDAVRALVQAVPLTRMPRGEREILLIELKPGMELARPIFNTNNMKLLDAGLILEEKHVNKVHSINNMTPINPLCLVYC